MRKLAAPLLILIAAGCQPTDLRPALHGDVMIPDGPQVSSRREAVTIGDGPNGAHIIFLNFDTTTINAGQSDDSSTNTSWIATKTATYGFNAAPYAGSMTADQAKQNVATWMTKFFAPVNAQIVTTRPPAGKRYTMCMIGGSPATIGLSSGGAAGVAPLDCGNMLEEEVVYAFASVLTPQNTGGVSESLKEIAVTCAQEVAHAYGLGHTSDQTDIMYPQLSSSTVGFQGLSNIADSSGKCGNGSTQDSLAMLKGVLGASTGNPMTGPTPDVMFVTPKNGDTVPLNFTILVNASETGGTISKVEITSGGSSIATLTAAPYKKMVTAPMNGTYQLTATATDALGNFNSTSVSFTASSSAPPQVECTVPADCGTGMTCNNGMCQPTSSGGNCSQPCPTGTTCQPDGTCKANGGGGGVGGGGGGPGGVGAMCENGGQCASGICAQDGSNHFCTQSCDPAKASSCPDGSSCVSAGADHICEPNNLTGGGVGCGSVVGGRHDSGMFGLCLALALLGIFQLARRRRA